MLDQNGLISSLPGLEVPYHPARWIGGDILPEIVVLHDTASRLEEGAAANYLQNNSAKVSAHFVIERSGEITQQVPVFKRANHAGSSSFEGRSGCNRFSIGIELVNPGKMTSAGDGLAMAWFGREYGISGEGIRYEETPEHGSGWWMPYTEAQMETLHLLLERLFEDVPSLRDITTHWYVSPGRKIDTNPLFPLEQIRARILGRDDPAEERANAASFEEGDRHVKVQLSSGSLNMRRWPSFNPNVLGTIPNGMEVPVLRHGTFADREWLKVRFNGQEGWVVARYTSAATKASIAEKMLRGKSLR